MNHKDPLALEKRVFNAAKKWVALPTAMIMLGSGLILLLSGEGHPVQYGMAFAGAVLAYLLHRARPLP